MTKVLIPNFVQSIMDEFSGGPFGRIIGCIITDKEGMFRFMPGMNDGGGIGGNGKVGRWT